MSWGHSLSEDGGWGKGILSSCYLDGAASGSGLRPSLAAGDGSGDRRIRNAPLLARHPLNQSLSMTACIPTLIYQLIVCIITIYYPLLTSTSSYVSNLPLLITVPLAASSSIVVEACVGARQSIALGGYWESFSNTN